MSVLCALKQPGNTVKANVGGSIRREPWVNANCSTVYIKRQIKLAFCCQKSSCLQCYFVNKKKTQTEQSAFSADIEPHDHGL